MCCLCYRKTPLLEYKEQENKPLINANTSDDLSPKTKSKEKDGANNKDKICNLCGFIFTMFKRQHHCRLCDSSCCDDCSKKRAVVQEQQVGTMSVVHVVICYVSPHI